MHIKRTPTYPDELPDINIESIESDLEDEHLRSLEESVRTEVCRSLDCSLFVCEADHSDVGGRMHRNGYDIYLVVHAVRSDIRVVDATE